MKKIEIKDATEPLADCVLAIGMGPLVGTRRGRPVAALVPIDGADWESVSPSMNPEFIAIIERARRQLRTGGGIPSAEVRRRLGLGKAAR